MTQAQTSVAPAGPPAPEVQPLPSNPVVNAPRGPDIGAGGIVTPNGNGTSTNIGPTGGTQVAPNAR